MQMKRSRLMSVCVLLFAVCYKSIVGRDQPLNRAQLRRDLPRGDTPTLPLRLIVIGWCIRMRFEIAFENASR